MSEYKVPDCNCVHNAVVYGLDESIRRAKFPMAVDPNKPTTKLTDGIKSLGQCKPGSGHDQFLTGIIVQFDWTFTTKLSVELERYSFMDYISSQSQMHRITRFDLDNAYIEYVDPRIIAIMKEKIAEYNSLSDYTDADKKKQLYLEILYSNPAGFKLTAGMTTNYRQLKTIYGQRRTHRLLEWREFCKWIETLPHSELITGYYDKEKEA